MSQSAMDQGGEIVFGSIIGVVLLGLVLFVGLIVAVRRGWIPRGGATAMAVLAIIVVLAILLWLGPGVFLL